MATLSEEWEAEAERWIAWARAPGHDSYWRFHRDHLLSLLPPPGRRTLDVGCGEGRVSRDLSELGHRVVGLDRAPTMARAAARHPAAEPIVIGDAASLPFPDGCVDLVVAFMSFQDLDDLAGAVAETARVLEPGGRVVLAIVHPLNSAGGFDGPDRDATFALERPYLRPAVTDESFEKAGLSMRFVSAHRPIEDYSRAVEAAGLLIEAIREPTETGPDATMVRSSALPPPPPPPALLTSAELIAVGLTFLVRSGLSRRSGGVVTTSTVDECDECPLVVSNRVSEAAVAAADEGET